MTTATDTSIPPIVESSPVATPATPLERLQAIMDVIDNHHKGLKAAHSELKHIQASLIKLENTANKSSKKNKKDPDAPKRPRTAYIYFCEDQRSVLKTKHQEMTQVQLMSKLGELWKALNDKKKHKYNEHAAKDKVRYTKDMAEYATKKLNSP